MPHMDYLATLAVIVLSFNAFYLLALTVKDNSVVDSLWGVAFMIAGVYAFVNFADPGPVQIIALILVTVWALRLSVRILARNAGKPEDWRYQKWRQEWNPQWFYLRSYVQIFLLQAWLCFVIALPVIFIMANQSVDANVWLVGAAVMVWLVGFGFETVGDWQLDRFVKRRQKAEILNSGLWRYSRHPNYFGEATLWWGIWLLAISLDPAGWWTILGPITVTFLLLKVSGVPVLEAKMKLNSKYRKYMRQTNMFFPGPVKKRG